MDRDGTIIDLHTPFLRIARQSAARLAGNDRLLRAELLRAAGCAATSDRVDTSCVFAAGTIDDVTAVWGALLPHWSTVSLEKEIEAVSIIAMAEAPALRGAIQAIETLAMRGFILGIATNATDASARTTAERLGIERHLHFIAGCDSGFGAKPRPGMAQAFCAASGLRPDQVAIVGDTPHDIGTGRNAGLGHCIGVLSGAGSADDLAAADVVLPSLADLPAWLSARE